MMMYVDFFYKEYFDVKITSGQGRNPQSWIELNVAPIVGIFDPIVRCNGGGFLPRKSASGATRKALSE